MLIKVWTELDNGKCCSLPAKIVNGIGAKSFDVKYLSPTSKKDSKNRKIYAYEDETYTITDESVSEYLNSDSELDLGFQKIGENEYIKYDFDEDDEDSDEDYVPSSSSCDSSSSDDDDDLESVDDDECEEDDDDDIFS